MPRSTNPFDAFVESIQQIFLKYRHVLGLYLHVLLFRHTLYHSNTYTGWYVLVCIIHANMFPYIRWWILVCIWSEFCTYHFLICAKYQMNTHQYRLVNATCLLVFNTCWYVFNTVTYHQYIPPVHSIIHANTEGTYWHPWAYIVV